MASSFSKKQANRYHCIGYTVFPLRTHHYVNVSVLIQFFTVDQIVVVILPRIPLDLHEIKINVGDVYENRGDSYTHP